LTLTPLFVSVGADKARIFAGNDLIIRLEDETTDEIITCTYETPRGPIPATVDLPPSIEAEGSGSLEIDYFGRAVTSTGLDIGVVATPAGESIDVICTHIHRCGTPRTHVLIDGQLAAALESGQLTAIFGEAGDDRFTLDPHSPEERILVVHGGSGNDLLAVEDSPSQGFVRGYSLFGDGGNDALYGARGRDYLAGGDGNDYIDGGPDDDTIDEAAAGESGANGSDTIIGGAGSDRVSYLNRTNAVSITLDGIANDGESGETDNVGSDLETIIAGNGDDHLVGGGDPDTLLGGNGNDDLHGGLAIDHLYGGLGADQLFGDDGPDELIGDEGDDEIDGGSGEDSLDGGPGADMMLGRTGDDTFFAADGTADSLDGGYGTDDAYIDPALDSVFRIEIIH
jgi:Ca2+-binding RTX toxin-like protein